MKPILSKYSNTILLIVMTCLLLLQMLWLINTYKGFEKTFDFLATSAVKEAGMRYTNYVAKDFLRKMDSLLTTKNQVEKGKYNTNDIYSMESKYKLYSRFNNEDSVYVKKLSVKMSKIDTIKLMQILSGVLLDKGIDSDFKINMIDYNGTQKSKDGNYFQAIIVIPGVEEKYILLQVNFTEMSRLILKKTMPLFSLIIIFTGLLFFLYYRTLEIFKKQKGDLESKNHFINNMTHELKTPISSIQLAADSLLVSNDYSASNVNKYLKIISDQGSKLNILVQKVLDTARAENNEFELVLESVDIKKIIQQSIEKLKSRIETLNVKLSFISNAASGLILADPFYMESVFVNLIDNSIKYAKNKPEILIETKEREGMVIVTIKDNGIGISKENQKKVFQKFFRVEGTDTHNIKGHGLGLTLVKEIIKLHKGNINLNSEISIGTTIELKIPLLDE